MKNGKWFLSSSNKGGLSATVGGTAGIGAAFVADYAGVFDSVAKIIATALNAVNVPAETEILSGAMQSIAYIVFGGYALFGFSRKIKNWFFRK